MKQYDLIIVGSGSGLMVLEAALAKGLSCALVENGKFGGTCLNRGCIPSKMLVYPADLIREAALGERVGVHLEPVTADWSVAAQRMWEQSDHNQQIDEGLHNVQSLDVYKATASFTDAYTLRLQTADGAEAGIIAGKRILIATGARSWVPPVPGLEEVGYLTSETFFGERFPQTLWKRVVIVGGGAIGAEFAHIFSAFGCQVTVVEKKPRLIATEEPEISAFVQRQFADLGIEALTGHTVVSAGRQGDHKTLKVQADATGEIRTLETDEIFVASGIRPNSDQLNCAAAGVVTDARGWIVTDEFLETSQKHIFAIGDINGKYQFRHKANYEAEVLIHNLFLDGQRQKALYDAVPWAIFTWPQVGHVGMTEQEAKAKGHRVWVGRNTYADVVAGAAMGFRASGRDNGFVKVIVDEHQKILGAHIVGPQAAALVQPFVYLMNAGYQCDRSMESPENRAWWRERRRLREACLKGGTLKPVMNSMVIHPSLNELTAWALDSIDWDHEA